MYEDDSILSGCTASVPNTVLLRTIPLHTPQWLTMMVLSLSRNILKVCSYMNAALETKGVIGQAESSLSAAFTSRKKCAVTEV